jgi:hypothetical protein
VLTVLLRGRNCIISRGRWKLTGLRCRGNMDALTSMLNAEVRGQSLLSL